MGSSGIGLGVSSTYALSIENSPTQSVRLWLDKHKTTGCSVPGLNGVTYSTPIQLDYRQTSIALPGPVSFYMEASPGDGYMSSTVNVTVPCGVHSW